MAIRVPGMAEAPGRFIIMDNIRKQDEHMVRQFIGVAELVLDKGMSVPNGSCNIPNEVAERFHNILTEESKLSGTDNGISQSEGAFRSLSKKLEHWLGEDFRNACSKSNILVTYNNIKKHELYMLSIMSSLGNNVMVISDASTVQVAKEVYRVKQTADIRDTSSLPREEYLTLDELYCSKESLDDLKESVLGDSGSDGDVSGVTSKKTKYTVDDIADTFNKNKIKIRFMVEGRDASFDSVELLKLIESPSQKRFGKADIIVGRIPRADYNEAGRINRIKNEDIHYMVNMYKLYINSPDSEISSAFSEAFIDYYMESGDRNVNKLYSMMVQCITWLNRYIEHDIVYVVDVDSISDTDKMFLRILDRCKGRSMIILLTKADASLEGCLSNFTKIKLSGECSMAEFNARNSIVEEEEYGVMTLAYKADKDIKSILFDGNTLGAVAQEQFIGCRTVLLRCTFEEFPTWWKEDILIRPGYSTKDRIVKAPSLFGVVYGTGDRNELFKIIGDLKMTQEDTLIWMDSDDKEVLDPMAKAIKNLDNYKSDMRYLIGAEFNAEEIKRSYKYYKYNTLSITKQEHIIDKVSELMEDLRIQSASRMGRMEYREHIFLCGIFLSDKVIKMIQRFKFNDACPKLIRIYDSTKMYPQDMVMICLLNSLGFDVLVMSPRGSRTMDAFVDAKGLYEVYDLGNFKDDCGSKLNRAVLKARGDIKTGLSGWLGL